MRSGIIINTSDHETVRNALLANSLGIITNNHKNTKIMNGGLLNETGYRDQH